jgi:sulfur carrier protein
MMLVEINGESVELASEKTVLAVLEKYQLKAAMTVVEKNSRIVDKETYSKESVSEGDKLELIRFMGGG